MTLSEAERAQIASDLERDLDARLAKIGIGPDATQGIRDSYRIDVTADGRILVRLDLPEDDPLGALAGRIAREVGHPTDGPRGLTREKADEIRARVRAEQASRSAPSSYHERLRMP